MDYKEKVLLLQRMSNCKAVLKEWDCSKNALCTCALE